jgi:leucyl-tRNA synthetase
VMHLLYFRFWTRVMKEMGLLSVDEPVKRLVTQGIVNGPDGRKMSKRWGNVISPRAIIEKYGADTARLFVMFAGPPENDIDWSDEQVEGQYRFAGRLWRLARAHESASGKKLEGKVEGDALAIRRIAHKCLKRVTESMEKLSFNTAIAGVMEAVNALYAIKESAGANIEGAWAEAVRILAVCMSPFSPHLSDELAEMFGETRSLQAQSWPEFDPALVVDDVVSYAVQVNGKLRGEVGMPIAATEAEVRAAAESLESLKPHLAGKTVRKFVFVPKRLVNFVVG